MKKVFYAALVVMSMGLASCGSSYSTTTHTATTVGVATSVVSQNVADLEVGNRVTYKYTTTREERMVGLGNCKAAAIAAMLHSNGNADVIVAPEYKYDNALNYIEVTGRPAKYSNFRSAN